MPPYNQNVFKRMYNNKILRHVIFLLISMVLGFVNEAFAQTQLTTYFKDTEYELNVYKINGVKKGPTLMIIGGIQGDEPGGYLSADLYADIALVKGNLIVVPRANLLSIIKNRRLINKDMNRQFTKAATEKSYEDKVVEILEGLISQSDYLLNLHEGSGYYSDVWESDMVNPDRFGQSIIADSDEYKTKDGRILQLGRLARTVIDNVNIRIENSRHHFRFNNHKTFEHNTIHADQRGSATYFALSNHNIPAFGIETSKDIKNIEIKVRYQTMMINEFMKQLDIVPENPKIALDPPTLKYLVVSVNGSDRIVKNAESLRLNNGDNISISHIEANYKRGLTVDVDKLGTSNDLNMMFKLTKPIKAIVRKDGLECGYVNILIDNKNNQVISDKIIADFKYLIVEENGNVNVLKNGQHLSVVKGDSLKIIDVVVNGETEDDIDINFVGFVSNRHDNNGNDKGAIIDTAKDLLIKYSKDGLGKEYIIKISKGKNIIGNVFVDIIKPELKYIVLRQDETKLWLSDGDIMTIYPLSELVIVDIRTNIIGNSGIEVSLNGREINLTREKAVINFSDKGKKSPKEYILKVMRAGMTIGTATLKISKPINQLTQAGIN